MAERGMTDTETRGRLERLTSDLKSAFGEELQSVVLYGSAARGDHMGGGSDLNVVVVVTDLALPKIERGTQIMRAWEAQGNRPLLFVSPDWIELSRDVFPIEFLDIIESHIVVFGPDPFVGLAVSRENLRLQCESELKTRLIQLRTGYIQGHDDADRLSALMAASYAPVVALCRAALRIAGAMVPLPGADVVKDASMLCGFDAAPFMEVAAVKRSGPSAASIAIKPLFKQYYAQVETLARAVDAGLPRAQGAKR